MLPLSNLEGDRSEINMAAQLLKQSFPDGEPANPRQRRTYETLKKQAAKWNDEFKQKAEEERLQSELEDSEEYQQAREAVLIASQYVDSAAQARFETLLQSGLFATLYQELGQAASERIEQSREDNELRQQQLAELQERQAEADKAAERLTAVQQFTQHELGIETSDDHAGDRDAPSDG